MIQKEDSDHKTAVVDELLSVASETGLPPAQVAMAWLRERAARSTTPTVPIIGPRNLDQLDGYLAALDVSLAPEHHDRLTTVSDIALGSPTRPTPLSVTPCSAVRRQRSAPLRCRRPDLRRPAVIHRLAFGSPDGLRPVRLGVAGG